MSPVILGPAPEPPVDLEALRAQLAQALDELAAARALTTRLWSFVDLVRAELAEPGAITRAEISTDLATLDDLRREQP